VSDELARQIADTLSPEAGHQTAHEMQPIKPHRSSHLPELTVGCPGV